MYRDKIRSLFICRFVGVGEMTTVMRKPLVNSRRETIQHPPEEKKSLLSHSSHPHHKNKQDVDSFDRTNMLLFGLCILVVIGIILGLVLGLIVFKSTSSSTVSRTINTSSSSSTGSFISPNLHLSPQQQYLTLLATNPYQNDYAGYSTNNGTLNCTSNRNFYIDQFAGSNSNNGLTPQTAWQSLEQVVYATYTGGDTIWICKNNRHFFVAQYPGGPEGLGVVFKMSPSLVDGCSVKVRSYDCGQSIGSSQSLPLITTAYPLPQVTNFNGYTFQWLPMTYTLYNGTQIPIVYYNTTNMAQNFYQDPIYGWYPFESLFVNNVHADQSNQIPPPSIIPSDSQLPYYNGGNVTLWSMNEIWHLDASVTQYAFAQINSTATNYTLSISPGSWCRNIYSLLFGSNETLYNATFHNPNQFLINGQIYYSTLAYQFTTQSILQVIPPDFRCCWFYQTYVVPWGTQNGIDLSLGWNNHLIDQIGVNSALWGTPGYTPARFIISGSFGNANRYSSDTPWPYPFRLYGYQYGFGIVTGSMYISNNVYYYYPRSQTEYNALLYTDSAVLSNKQTVYRNPNLTVAVIRPTSNYGAIWFQQGNIEIQEIEFAFFGQAITLEGGTLSVHHCLFHDYTNTAIGATVNPTNFIAFNNILYNSGSGLGLHANQAFIINSTFLNIGEVYVSSTALIRNISHTNTWTDWVIGDGNPLVELSTFNSCQLSWAEWNCMEFNAGTLRFNFIANEGNGDKLLRFHDNHDMIYHAGAYGLDMADNGPYLFYGNIVWNFSIQGTSSVLTNNLFINADQNNFGCHGVNGGWFPTNCNFTGFDNNTSIFQTRRTHPYGPVDYYPYEASTAFPFTTSIFGLPPNPALAQQQQSLNNYACFAQFDYNISAPNSTSFLYYPNMNTTSLWNDYYTGYGPYWPYPYALPTAPCTSYCDGVSTGQSISQAQFFYVSTLLNQYYLYGASQNISFGIHKCSNMTQMKQQQLQNESAIFAQTTEPLVTLLTAGYFQNYSAPINWTEMIYSNPYYVGLIPAPVITSSPPSYSTLCPA